MNAQIALLDSLAREKLRETAKSLRVKLARRGNASFVTSSDMRDNVDVTMRVQPSRIYFNVALI